MAPEAVRAGGLTSRELAAWLGRMSMLQPTGGAGGTWMDPFAWTRHSPHTLNPPIHLLPFLLCHLVLLELISERQL